MEKEIKKDGEKVTKIARKKKCMKIEEDAR